MRRLYGPRGWIAIGADKSARFLVGIARKGLGGVELRSVQVNGLPGALVMEDGAVIATIAVDVAEGKAVGIYIVSNPEKLGAVQPGAAGPSPFLA